MHYFWQGRGKLSPFWMSCVDMVETLLGLLEHLEKRMGNFTSHLTTKFSLGALHMIISTTAGTICISAWNITFTRETPGHLEYFRSGGFSVQMSEDEWQPFRENTCWSDIWGNCQQGHSDIKRNQRSVYGLMQWANSTWLLNIGAPFSGSSKICRISAGFLPNT